MTSLAISVTSTDLLSEAISNLYFLFFWTYVISSSDSPYIE